MLGQELLVGASLVEAAASLRLDAVEDLEQELGAKSGVAEQNRVDRAAVDMQPVSGPVVKGGGHGRSVQWSVGRDSDGESIIKRRCLPPPRTPTYTHRRCPVLIRHEAETLSRPLPGHSFRLAHSEEIYRQEEA